MKEFETQLYVDGEWTVFGLLREATLIREIPEGQIFSRLTLDGNFTAKGDENTTLLALREADIYSVPFRLYEYGELVFEGEFGLRDFHNYDLNMGTMQVKAQDVYTPIYDNISVIYNLYNVLPNIAVGHLGIDYRARKLFGYRGESVIEYLISQMYADSDYEITFLDSYPLTTDSFFYFRSQPKYENLLWSHIRDVINPAGAEAETWQISFETLFQFLSDLHRVGWRIIETGGAYIFQVKHLSEINFEVGTKPAHDLTDYFNRNWSYRKNAETYELKDKTNRYVRTATGSGEDFLGVDLLVPNLVDGETKEVNLANVSTDLEDIVANPDNYPQNTNKQFFYWAANANIRIKSITGWINPDGRATLINWADPDLEFAGNPQFFIYSNVLTGIGEGDLITYEFNLELLESVTISFVGMDSIGVNEELIPLGPDVVGTPTSKRYFSADNGDQTLHATVNKGYAEIRIRIEGSSATEYVNGMHVDVRTYSSRQATGSLTTDLHYNADLSIANTDDYDLAGMPDKTVIVNNVEEILADNRVTAYREQVEIPVPIFNILDDFDFNQLVKTDLDDMRITSVQKPTVNGVLGTIVLRR